jgi:hypothetical protein
MNAFGDNRWSGMCGSARATNAGTSNEYHLYRSKTGPRQLMNHIKVIERNLRGCCSEDCRFICRGEDGEGKREQCREHDDKPDANQHALDEEQHQYRRRG